MSLACVAGTDAAEAVCRLNGRVLDDKAAEELLEAAWDGWDHPGPDDVMLSVGVADVPRRMRGRPAMGLRPHMPGVTERLSIGTVCYAMYANPAQGSQGSVIRNGITEEWDLTPGGPDYRPGIPADMILRRTCTATTLSRTAAPYAGVRPHDARAFLGPPDMWVRLPDGDYWTHLNAVEPAVP